MNPSTMQKQGSQHHKLSINIYSRNCWNLLEPLCRFVSQSVMFPFLDPLGFHLPHLFWLFPQLLVLLDLLVLLLPYPPVSWDCHVCHNLACQPLQCLLGWPAAACQSGTWSPTGSSLCCSQPLSVVCPIGTRRLLTQTLHRCSSIIPESLGCVSFQLMTSNIFRSHAR